MPIFDLKTDDQIKEFMQDERKNHNKPYVELSRRIPKYSPKQICHRWNYKLNPRLTDGPFTQEEKEFIYKWGKNNKNFFGEIKWSHCQRAMEKKFNKFRAVNRILGMWLTHFKRRERRVKTYNFPGTSVIDFSNVYNHPHVKQPDTSTTTIVSNVPLLRFRPPRLPTLIPNFQPEMNLPKMMPLF
ncbi:11840_t:CDS:2 [Funneliformis geosporum]|uniref:699_t:CDS:1 n=1 Tax=Funneliformis geosporum TaxID=1117311 RepID=A0A9W4T4J8_9GLOM|nr:699_t:CDS:2 [Funneliformis geosporum]CAI2192079.1 11840_t:CDS:2 [Funneliformis geosporum]